jgi:hypothetical protein
MSFQNLTRLQGNELARLLMALGRALVLASIVALLFPHEGEGLRVMWAVLGIILGGIIALVGVLMLKEGGERKRRNRR